MYILVKHMSHYEPYEVWNVRIGIGHNMIFIVFTVHSLPSPANVFPNSQVQACLSPRLSSTLRYQLLERLGRALLTIPIRIRPYSSPKQAITARCPSSV